MRRRSCALLVVLLVFAAACSSTNIRDRENAVAAGEVETGASTTAVEGGDSTATTSGAVLPGAPTTAGGTDADGQPVASLGGSTPPAKSTASDTPPAAGDEGPIGPGVSDTEINIGISLFKAGDYGAAFGIKGVDFGNTEAQAQAVVDHINANGGIRGRVVKPIYYTLDFGRPGLSDGQSEQEACAKWTEDNKVFAILNSVMARTALLVCLAKRDVPGVHDGLPLDEATINQYHPYYWTTSGGPGLSLDRQAAAQVEVFGQRGFWNDAVVGIEYFEDKGYERVVNEVWIPRLKKYGVQKIVTQAAPRGGAEGASYAARFQREGVTHVVFMGEAALYPLFFMRAAENQLYYPKYGLNTEQQLAVTLQAAAPPAQLANAIGVGWHPITDTDAAHDPGLPNAQTELCFDIQRKAGQDMSARGAAGTALSYCSGLFFLEKAIEAAPTLNSAGLASAVASFGSSYVSPGNYGTFYEPGRHTGVARYRDLGFKDGAFYYTSDVKDLPV